MIEEPVIEEPEIKPEPEPVTLEGLSNFRFNRLGGVDAEFTLNGEVLPTTLSDAQVDIIPDDVEVLPFNDVQYQTALIISAFKKDREGKLNRASVTISTGKTFDADETSITRLNNAINAARNESGDYIIPWSTADVPTGVMVDCTKAELEEAHTEAVIQMGEIWKV